MLTIDSKEFVVSLGNINKNIHFAGVVALTRTAVIARKDVQKKMVQIFDRPTPYALNSIYVEPAKKEDTEPVAKLGFKSLDMESAKGKSWVNPQMFGGPRVQKSFEKAISDGGVEAAGIQTGRFRFLVPTRIMKRDGYGNVPRSQLNKMKQDIVGAVKEGSIQKTKAPKVGYFVRYNKGGRPMIFNREALAKRHDQGAKQFPAMIFVAQPKYKPHFPAGKIIEESVDANLEKEYAKAIVEFVT